MVPGPRTADYTSDSQLSTTVDESTTETIFATLQSSSPMPAISTFIGNKESNLRTSNNVGKLALEIGSPLFYGLVAAGSAIILILLLCLIGVSVFACWRGCK